MRRNKGNVIEANEGQAIASPESQADSGSVDINKYEEAAHDLIRTICTPLQFHHPDHWSYGDIGNRLEQAANQLALSGTDGIERQQLIDFGLCFEAGIFDVLKSWPPDEVVFHKIIDDYFHRAQKFIDIVDWEEAGRQMVLMARALRSRYLMEAAIQYYESAAQKGLESKESRVRGAIKKHEPHAISKKYCIDRAQVIWKKQPTCRIGDMTTALLFDLKRQGLYAPTQRQIRKWLKDAEKQGWLKIPPAASKAGRPALD